MQRSRSGSHRRVPSLLNLFSYDQPPKISHKVRAAVAPGLLLACKCDGRHRDGRGN